MILLRNWYKIFLTVDIFRLFKIASRSVEKYFFRIRKVENVSLFNRGRNELVRNRKNIEDDLQISNLKRVLRVSKSKCVHMCEKVTYFSQFNHFSKFLDHFAKNYDTLNQKLIQVSMHSQVNTQSPTKCR